MSGNQGRKQRLDAAVWSEDHLLILLPRGAKAPDYTGAASPVEREAYSIDKPSLGSCRPKRFFLEKKHSSVELVWKGGRWAESMRRVAISSTAIEELFFGPGWKLGLWVLRTGWTLFSPRPRNLAQPPWRLRIPAHRSGEVVAEELGGDDAHHGAEPLGQIGGEAQGGARQGQRLVLVGDGNQLGTALFDQGCEQRQKVFEHRPSGHRGEDGKALGDEGHRTMLQVGGRVRLGEDAGELFELQRPLGGRRVIEAAAEHHALCHVPVLSGRLLDGGGHVARRAPPGSGGGVRERRVARRSRT